MELKLNIAYQQVFNLLKQLPVAEWKKLRGEIDKELTEKKQKSDKRVRGGLGCLKGKVWMADDFNDPIDDFKEYMP